jgi:hypothetical protein
MRRIFAATVLISPLFLSAAALASQSPSDAVASTHRLSTGVTPVQIVYTPKIELSPAAAETTVPNAEVVLKLNVDENGRQVAQPVPRRAGVRGNPSGSLPPGKARQPTCCYRPDPDRRRGAIRRLSLFFAADRVAAGRGVSWRSTLHPGAEHAVRMEIFCARLPKGCPVPDNRSRFRTPCAFALLSSRMNSPANLHT